MCLKYDLTLRMLVNLLSADFFKNLLFKKFFSGKLSEFQTVWIPIRTSVRVETFCKGYQQMTKVVATKERFTEDRHFSNLCPCKIGCQLM